MRTIFFLLIILICSTQCKKSPVITGSGNTPGTVTGVGTGSGSGSGNGSGNGYCGNFCITGIPGLSTSYSSFFNNENTHRGAIYLKGKFIFAGGFWHVYGVNETDIYDTTTNTWFDGGTLSRPRGFITASYAGNKAIFAGGYEYYNNGTWHNTVDLLDVSTLQWTTAQLSEARKSMASASLFGKAYFIGGQTSSGFSKKIDIYNAETGTWSVKELNEPRGFCGAAVIDGKTYIGGGQNSSGNIRRVDIYDPVMDQWSAIEAPNEHPEAAVVSAGKKLFIAGGNGSTNKTVDVYDTESAKWETFSLSDAKKNIAVAVVKNRIIFIGNGYSDKIDLYDIDSGKVWSSSFTSGVNGVSACSSGTMAIFGGFGFDAGVSATNLVMIFR